MPALVLTASEAPEAEVPRVLSRRVEHTELTLLLQGVVGLSDQVVVVDIAGKPKRVDRRVVAPEGQTSEVGRYPLHFETCDRILLEVGTDLCPSRSVVEAIDVLKDTSRLLPSCGQVEILLGVGGFGDSGYIQLEPILRIDHPVDAQRSAH